MNITLDNYLYKYYIKYDRLNELVVEAFKNINSNSVYIYIDLYSVAKSAYNHGVIPCDEFALSSVIINMAAHYRKFFRYIGVDCFIVFVYGNNTGRSNTQFYSEYNRSAKSLYSLGDRYNLISTALSLVSAICQYLPNVRYIATEFETSVVIYNLIQQDTSIPSIIITKDVYAYQLPAVCDTATIFRPKKYNVDCSYFINKQNVLQTYAAERKISIDQTISPELLSMIFTLSALKDRSIKMYMSINKAMNIISNSIQAKHIVNRHNIDISYLYDDIDKSKMSLDILILRFKAIDIVYQNSIYSISQEYSINQQIIGTQLNDGEAIRAINDKYYAKCPLDLNGF